MEINYLSLFFTIVVGAISVAISFFIKDFLQRNSEFKSFKSKLDQIVGKNAMILYSPDLDLEENLGAMLYKIVDINKHGLTLKNELHEIYVPISKLLQSDIILPCDDYEHAVTQKMLKDFEKNVDIFIPVMFNKLIPSIEKAIEDKLKDDVLFRRRVVESLIKEGFELTKKPSKNPDDNPLQIKE